MRNSKTKGALIMSVVSMVLCVAMLMGTTLAWFTDSASTGVNKIQAGNLDVDIVDENDVSLAGKTLNFKKAAGHENEPVLWEPGCRYELDSFNIVNKGSLAFRYKVEINNIVKTGNEVSLLDVIEFSVKIGNGTATLLEDWDGILLPAGKAAANNDEEVGETGMITITGHMKEEAGNEYQGLALDGISITVYATQYTYEADSFDNTYDARATYPAGKIYSAGSQDDLAKLATVVKPGDTISITKDFTMNKTVQFTTNDITFEGNGHTITGDNDVVVGETLIRFGKDGAWCQNITVQNINFNGKGGRVFHFHGGNSSTLNNVTIVGEYALPINFYGTHGGTMNNCSISSTATAKYANASVFANQQSADQLILNNTTIDDLYINVSNNDASTLANNGVKLVVNSGSTVGKLHLPAGTTLVPYQVNGGTIGEVVYDN